MNNILKNKSNQKTLNKESRGGEKKAINHFLRFVKQKSSK